jgi:RNA polymerase sigma-70 factor (ECF subfamily)
MTSRDIRNTEPSPEDDALIVASIADPDAFGQLYERYREAIYLYCYRRLASVDRAEDATAAIFLRAFHARDRFRPASAGGTTFRSWLFTIAHNIVIDLWRRDRQHRFLDPDLPVRDVTQSPEDLAIGADEDRRVRALLARLPERHRAAVELRLAGLSTAETAAALGISVSATKSLQFRAYRTLRDLLETSPTTLSLEASR